MPAVHVTYYTDPACPWSWAAEPAFRRLLARFGDELRITYVMGGMARRFGDPVHVLGEVLDAAAESAMPVDPRLWLDHPPASSYPSCLAVKAAAEQSLDGAYLRRAREGLMCQRRKLDNADALVEIARGVEGMNVERFAIDLSSNAITESFAADLERARAAASDQQDESGRVPFPTFEVEEHGGLYGEAPAEGLERLVRDAGAAPAGGAPGVQDALRRFGRMATAEVAAVCDLPGPRAAAELWRLAAEWRVRPERVLTGELWSAT
ncbi:MAG: DsbA family protein [Actinomycetota bacterium]|nr:DsbA family protein [Actinomycetota bacterium]